jgi:hypothetical protein
MAGQACCGVESVDEPNRGSQKGDTGTAVVPRWVAQLDFREIQQFKPFEAAQLRVTPLPVLHGEDLVSLGFSFGERELVRDPLDTRPCRLSCTSTPRVVGTARTFSRGSHLSRPAAPYHHPPGVRSLVSLMRQLGLVRPSVGGASKVAHSRPVIHAVCWNPGCPQLNLSWVGRQVVYLSDVSRVPPETMEWLARRPIDVLVVDALYKDRPHPTHFSLPEALEFVRRVKPKRAILVGMSDDIEYGAVRAGFLHSGVAVCGVVVAGAETKAAECGERLQRGRSLHLRAWIVGRVGRAGARRSVELGRRSASS